MLKRVKKTLFLLISVMMLACLAVAATACGDDVLGGGSKNPPDKVSVESVSYDGSIIRWNSAAYASYYYLNINGSADLRSDSTTYTYPVSAVSTNSIEIKIRAVNELGESEPVTKNFYKMPTINESDIQFTEDGVMTWPAIEGASGYTVEVNNVEYQVAINVFSAFTYGQRNTIRVKANGADATYFSSYSAAISRTFLGTPTGVSYDGQRLTWQSVPNALSYSIFINGGELPEKPTSTVLDYDSQHVDFTVEIRANGDGSSVFNSNKSELTNFIYLQAPTNIRVDKGHLIWDAVDKAESYLVEANNVTTTVKEPTYKLIAGEYQRVRIKPVATSGGFYFSDWTNEESYFVLEPPTLRWDNSTALDGEAGKNLQWNTGGNNISSYKVELTSPSGHVSEHDVSADAPAFSYGYTEVGTYTVSVLAKAVAGSGVYDSDFSSPLKIVRLPAPTQASNFITSDMQELSAGFTVNFNAVSGAKQYRLYKNGVNTNQTTNTQSMKVTQVVDSTVTEMQIIQYKLQSVGSNGRIENGTVTLDSLSSESLIIDITVLARPENVNISGQTMTWDGVAQANGYVVNRGAYGIAYNNQYDLGAITDAGSYQVSVCSRGNGSNVLPSGYTPSISVVKLAAPSYIRINTGVNGGNLQFDHDRNARSYNIYVNSLDTPIEEDNFGNINDHITQNTSIIVIVAVADWWVDSTYYLSSNRSQPKTFTKLAAVTFPNPAFTNTELQWNAPSNLQNGNISYAVFDESGYAYNERQDGTRFDLSFLEAGFYSFQVQALGDGENFINSEKSDTVAIQKLETPTVTRTTTSYQWTGVPSAARYIVYLDGVQVDVQDHTGMRTYEYTPNFTQIKTYKVEVVAVGDFYQTINSKPATLNQEIKRISTPTFRLSYDSDAFNVNGNIVVTITSSGENVTGYRYSFNGTLSTERTTETVYKYNAKNAGNYDIIVTALGGTFDNEGVYWYNSQETGSQRITIHAAPNKDTISINRDGVISWASVPNCSDYELVIRYSDGTAEKTVTVKGATYTDSNYQNIVSITIRAKGNGISSVTSEAVTWYKN